MVDTLTQVQIFFSLSMWRTYICALSSALLLCWFCSWHDFSHWVIISSQVDYERPSLELAKNRSLWHCWVSFLKYSTDIFIFGLNYEFNWWHVLPSNSINACSIYISSIKVFNNKCLCLLQVIYNKSIALGCWGSYLPVFSSFHDLKSQWSTTYSELLPRYGACHICLLLLIIQCKHCSKKLQVEIHDLLAWEQQEELK
jgi:hypothetical protein